MKKLLTAIAALVLSISICLLAVGCTDNQGDNKDDDTPDTPIVELN